MLRALVFPIVTLALAILGGPVVAQTLVPREPPRRSLPSKPKPRAPNSCAEYGAGFVRVEGSNTCVKMGGAISIGGGFAR